MLEAEVAGMRPAVADKYSVQNEGIQCCELLISLEANPRCFVMISWRMHLKEANFGAYPSIDCCRSGISAGQLLVHYQLSCAGPPFHVSAPLPHL